MRGGQRRPLKLKLRLQSADGQPVRDGAQAGAFASACTGAEELSRKLRTLDELARWLVGGSSEFPCEVLAWGPSVHLDSVQWLLLHRHFVSVHMPGPVAGGSDRQLGEPCGGGEGVLLKRDGRGRRTTGWKRRGIRGGVSTQRACLPQRENGRGRKRGWCHREGGERESGSVGEKGVGGRRDGSGPGTEDDGAQGMGETKMDEQQST